MRVWVLLVLVLLLITSHDYYVNHPKWAKCSFWVDIWQLSYDFWMLAMMGLWLSALHAVSHSEELRISLKLVFTVLFPAVQAAQLVYIVWGTYRIAEVMEKEAACVTVT